MRWKSWASIPKEGLAEVEGIWQRRRRKELLLDGVSMIAPETVFLSWDTKIEAGVTIEPNAVFAPGVSIKKRHKSKVVQLH